MNLKQLIGAGDRIGGMVLPILVIGLVLNFMYPVWFSVGGPVPVLRWLSIIVLVPGVIAWLWSVVLILTRVPRGQLITSGPFAVVRHPLYTSVALLVLPWVGFLLDSWLGAVLGLVLYAASRRYAPQEEAALDAAFGPAWYEYSQNVLVPWL